LDAFQTKMKTLQGFRDILVYLIRERFGCLLTKDNNSSGV
jgi:hypothetical protein